MKSGFICSKCNGEVLHFVGASNPPTHIYRCMNDTCKAVKYEHLVSPEPQIIAMGEGDDHAK